MNRAISTMIMVLVMSTISYSQKNALRKNVVHLTGGTIVFYYAWGLNYERMLADFDEKVINSLWISAGYGGWNDGWGGKGPLVNGMFRALMFNGKHHIEISVGYASRFDSDSYDRWIAEGMTNTNFNEKSDFWDGSMAGGIGWRVQKPGGHFMFRMGLAWPETAYLGLGYSFGK